MNPPQKGRGAPRGNRNAWKTGLHSAPMRALAKDTRLQLQKIKAALAMARKLSSPVLTGEVPSEAKAEGASPLTQTHPLRHARSARATSPASGGG